MNVRLEGCCKCAYWLGIGCQSAAFLPILNHNLKKSVRKRDKDISEVYHSHCWHIWNFMISRKRGWAEVPSWHDLGPERCHAYMLSHVSCVRLCNSMDCSLPGSSVQGILWARILELPCPSPGDLPHIRIKPTSLKSPALAGGFFTTSVTWGAPWSFLEPL